VKKPFVIGDKVKMSWTWLHTVYGTNFSVIYGIVCQTTVLPQSGKIVVRVHWADNTESSVFSTNLSYCD
jgi:hypothetical protein